MGPGSVFMAQTPGGMVQITVPPGLAPGARFNITVPGQQQQPMMMMPQQPMMVPQQPMMVPQQPMMMMQPAVQQAGMVVQPAAVQPQLGAAPQPMVMQQQQPPPSSPPPQVPDKEKEKPDGPQHFASYKHVPVEKSGPAKKGKSGDVIYDLPLSPLGVACEGCCSRDASLVGQLNASKKMPVELASATDMSPASWELIIEKLYEWQAKASVPCCSSCPCAEALCVFSCGCCCACTPCLMCRYSARDDWEEKVQAEVNEMLEQFNVKLKFAKQGCLGVLSVSATFLWV